MKDYKPNCSLLLFHHRQHYDSITYYGQNKRWYLKLAIVLLYKYYYHKHQDILLNCTQVSYTMLPQGSGRVHIKGKPRTFLQEFKSYGWFN